MSKPSRSMGELSADWKEFLSLLIARRVRFVVVGGHAVAVHAEPRFTQDLDLFVAATKTNAKAIRTCLVDFGFGDATPGLAVLATLHKVFMLGTRALRSMATGFIGAARASRRWFRVRCALLVVARVLGCTTPVRPPDQVATTPRT